MLSQAIVWIGLAFTLLSLFGPNPLLCIPSFISLYFIVNNLVISKYLTAFIVAFLYQWMQVSIKILYATVTFTDIARLTKFPSNIIEAYILSSIALIVVSYGISIQLKKIKLSDMEVECALKRVHFKSVVILYLCMGIITEGLMLIPGFFQFSVMTAGFKWGLFYLLFIYCHTQKRYKALLYLIITYEIGIGFFSYFASWKTVIFYILIGCFSVLRINSKRVLSLIIASCIVIYVALIWTGVKGEYRSFISGDNKQSVVVSSTDAYNKLFELASDFQLTDKVSSSLLDRMSYIDYFSSCLAYVPEEQPYETGNLTLAAIKHIFMPRALFPNKPIIDESSHLTKYTGVFYSNYSMGVSFSLGYVGDFYVDYGFIGMFVALFLLGFLIGEIFLSIFNGAPDKLLAVAILGMAFLLLYKFEISMLKLIGNITVFWILYRLLERFLFPYIIHFFIERPTHEE